MTVMRLGLQRALRETFQDFSRTFTPAALTELTATNGALRENFDCAARQASLLRTCNF